VSTCHEKTNLTFSFFLLTTYQATTDFEKKKVRNIFFFVCVAWFIPTRCSSGAGIFFVCVGWAVLSFVAAFNCVLKNHLSGNGKRIRLFFIINYPFPFFFWQSKMDRWRTEAEKNFSNYDQKSLSQFHNFVFEIHARNVSNHRRSLFDIYGTCDCYLISVR
jgi:hypothetical protein